MSRGRKKVKNPETARRILAAAERLFADSGMAGARTEEIAAAARINKAMLYYYFGDKRRLHSAVFENLLRQLREAMFASSSPHTPARERLLALLNGYFDFLVSHPNYPRLLMREAMESRGSFERIVREYLRPFHLRLVRTIQEGIAAGQFRRVDPHQSVLSITGMTVSYFAAAPILNEVLGRNLLARQALATRRRAILDFLEHALFRSTARSNPLRKP